MYDIIYEELSSKEIKKYLKRIGFTGEISRTKACLDDLIYSHQCHIPFECLDTYHTDASIPLDKDALYDKIVNRERGGFCFELNGLFVLLLRGLGFDAFSIACRVAAGRKDLGNISHRATIVRLDGKEYIVDVGFGGPMAAFAVELCERHQTGYGETYWVEDAPGGWKMICREKGEEKRYPTVLFSPVALVPKDFEPFCEYMLRNPECPFRMKRMVNLRTPDGSLEITNTTFLQHKGDAVIRQEFTETELSKILCSYFGIKYK